MLQPVKIIRFFLGEIEKIKILALLLGDQAIPSKGIKFSLA